MRCIIHIHFPLGDSIYLIDAGTRGHRFDITDSIDQASIFDSIDQARAVISDVKKREENDMKFLSLADFVTVPLEVARVWDIIES